MFGLLLKTRLKKQCNIAYRGRKEKKEISEVFGLCVLTLVLENTEYLTLNLWGLLRKNNIELNRKVLADLSNESS